MSFFVLAGAAGAAAQYYERDRYYPDEPGIEERMDDYEANRTVRPRRIRPADPEAAYESDGVYPAEDRYYAPRPGQADPYEERMLPPEPLRRYAPRERAGQDGIPPDYNRAPSRQRPVLAEDESRNDDQPRRPAEKRPAAERKPETKPAPKKPAPAIASPAEKAAPPAAKAGPPVLSLGIPPLPSKRGLRSGVYPAASKPDGTVRPDAPASPTETAQAPVHDGKTWTAAEKSDPVADRPATPEPPIERPAATPVAALVSPSPEPAQETRSGYQDAAASPETTAAFKITTQNDAQIDANRVEKAAKNSATYGPTPVVPADTLTKMIGQMLMVGFAARNPADPEFVVLSQQIAAGKIGGVLLRDQNVVTADGLRRLTAALNAVKTDPILFISADQEGGPRQVLAPGKGFAQHPAAQYVGRSNDPLAAHQTYAKLAAELKQAGANMNFGPVADLAQPGAGQAATQRHYGADPKHVTAFLKAFAVAHKDAGVLTVMKHFPEEYGSTNWTEAALEPYKTVDGRKIADLLMIGHASNPKYATDGLPASLSRATVQTLLRGNLGYEGVTITDDLEAVPVASRYPFEERVIRAIEAGNDILLIANRDNIVDLPERTIDVIRKAVASGRLSAERIRTSYDRILYLKRRYQKSLITRQAVNAPKPEAAAPPAAR